MIITDCTRGILEHLNETVHRANICVDNYNAPYT